MCSSLSRQSQDLNALQSTLKSMSSSEHPTNNHRKERLNTGIWNKTILYTKSGLVQSHYLLKENYREAPEWRIWTRLLRAPGLQSEPGPGRFSVQGLVLCPDPHPSSHDNLHLISPRVLWSKASLVGGRDPDSSSFHSSPARIGSAEDAVAKVKPARLLGHILGAVRWQRRAWLG